MKKKTSEILHKAHMIISESNYEGAPKTTRENAKREARKLYKLLKNIDPEVYNKLKAELD